MHVASENNQSILNKIHTLPTIHYVPMLQMRTTVKTPLNKHCLTLFPETPRPCSIVDRYLKTPSCRAVLPIFLTTGLDSLGFSVCLSSTQDSSTGPWWGMSPSVSSSWSISWRIATHRLAACLAAQHC